jgi:hypothetical protein
LATSTTCGPSRAVRCWAAWRRSANLARYPGDGELARSVLLATLLRTLHHDADVHAETAPFAAKRFTPWR